MRLWVLKRCFKTDSQLYIWRLIKTKYWKILHFVVCPFWSASRFSVTTNLFNIYLNDMYYFLDCNICSFVDYTTFYVSDKNLDVVLKRLEQQSNIALKWFEDYNMKMNSGNCHFCVSGNKHKQMWAKICEDKMWQSKTVKLLRITIDKWIWWAHKQCLHESAKETYSVDKNKKIPSFW